MFIFFDTETTSVKKDKLEIIQLAAKDDKKDGYTFCKYFKPKGKIEIGAMAVHHITEKKVNYKKYFDKDNGDVRVFAFSIADKVVVAHNAKFDIYAVSKYGIEIERYIDTLKLAKYFDTKGYFEAYNLQYLRYALGIEVKVDAHDAMGDVIVLEEIFKKIHKKAIKEWGDQAVNKMIEISKSPLLLRKMPFGKHKNQPCEEVPISYWNWLYESRQKEKDNSEQDEDLDYTINYYINK